MIEMAGSIWNSNPAYIRCITTNGIVKSNGELVMGRGIALQVKQRYPELPRLLGELVKNGGNIPYYIEDHNICSFPTKNHWWDKSDIKLIINSCHHLNRIVNSFDKYAVLTRPGCGNGGLSWETEVKPVISTILNNRVAIMNL